MRASRPHDPTVVEEVRPRRPHHKGQASRLPGGDKPLPYKTETKRGQVYSSQRVSRSAHSGDQFRSVGEGFIPSRAIAFRFCRADEFQPERVPTQWWRRGLFGRRDAIHSCRGGIYAAPTGNGLQLVWRGAGGRIAVGPYCRTALGRAAEFPRGPEPRSGDRCSQVNGRELIVSNGVFFELATEEGRRQGLGDIARGDPARKGEFAFAPRQSVHDRLYQVLGFGHLPPRHRR